MPEPVSRPDRSEAASRLRVSVRTIRRYGKSGLLEERRVGPQLVRITEASVDKLISDQGHPAA
ncbi:MAG TPA: helix-turn-helix domain-containing protein [Trebonia sp.]|jgi:excisionase family DNA binding protein|nr:helix-turn-helix domain-containing protein [Trebonia sp.]